MTEEDSPESRVPPPLLSSGPGPRRTASQWRDAAAGAGFALLLVAGCGVLGLVISLPLWAFATGARGTYSLVVMAAAAAGIVYLVVRAILRRRAAARDPSVPRRSTAAGFLAVLMVVVGLCGAWAAAALLVRGLWIMGSAGALAGGLLTWALGRWRNAAIARKARRLLAENQGR